MLDTNGFGDFLGCMLGRPQPLKTGVLDPLADEPGVVVWPKLNFPEVPLLGLQV